MKKEKIITGTFSTTEKKFRVANGMNIIASVFDKITKLWTVTYVA